MNAHNPARADFLRGGRRLLVAIWTSAAAVCVVPVVDALVHRHQEGLTPLVAACAVAVLVAGGLTAMVGSRRRELQAIAQGLSRATSGDLTVSLNHRYLDEGAARIASAATELLAVLHETVGLLSHGHAALETGTRELHAVSVTMSSTAETTAARASAVSVAAGQVSASTQRVAAATEEFHATTRDVSEHASEASNVAQSASTQAAVTNATVSELGESSRQVDRIVDLIGNIARQTHLLALNATLEAARAGEAGRGFAVVAGEVKQLAEQTAAATESVSATVRAMQSGASGAVEAISNITRTIDTVSETQHSIAAAVEQQTISANEIGRSATEAARGATDIADNIAALVDAARATAYAGAHARTTAAEFTDLADAFRAITDRYQLAADATAVERTTGGKQLATSAVTNGATTVVQNTVQGNGVHEIDYRGEWRHSTGNIEADGTNSYSCSPGDVAVVRFRGTKVSFFGVTDANHGLVGLSVDGGPETVVDEYSPGRSTGVQLWTSPTLAAGEHTLAIRVTGQCNAQSRYIWATVDRVEVSA
ncbi:MAG TPA: methyl-accepting chemotaxis protein [Acidothermaceae bacterium]|nr:methyl-accepting chemotaxis protein [Acidothermaceae bacterium]